MNVCVLNITKRRLPSYREKRYRQQRVFVIRYMTLWRTNLFVCINKALSIYASEFFSKIWNFDFLWINCWGYNAILGVEPGAMEQTGEDIMTSMIAEFERYVLFKWAKFID